MTHEEKKQVYDTLKTLNDFCTMMQKKNKCCECDLYSKALQECELIGNLPCEWALPKLTRWTSKDVALAKVLKEYGIDSIENSVGRIFLIRKGIAYMFDIGAFSNLECGETVSIDTIIKEAEE